MKTIKPFALSVLFILFFNSLYAIDNNSIAIANVNYQLITKKESTQLQIIIDFTVDNNTDSSDKNKQPYIEVIKSAYYKQILKYVTIDFTFPDYMNRIISFINDDSLKLIARELYQSENIINSTTDVINTNLKIENGKIYTKVNATLNFFIRFENETRITLPEVQFYYNNQQFKTQAAIVTLKK